MNECRASLSEALARVLDLLGEGEPATMTSAALVEVNGRLAQLRRLTDAAHAVVAAEIARRSRPELGSDGLSRRNGFRNAGAMLSASTGTPVGEAQRMIQVGEATAPQPTLSGELAPPRRPHIAAAVTAGALSTWAASAIVTLLDRVALRAGREQLDEMERLLAERAPGLDSDQLRRLLAQAEAHLDPDGVAPREEELRHHRSLTIRTDRDGMVVFTGALDPETAAPVVTAIHGMVSAALRRREDDPVVADTRSVTQLRADALAELCRHALGCDHDTALGLAGTTVIVRVDLATLQTGRGTATVDGIERPLSAGAARRLAAEAEIIPVVLGGESEILDWGRSRRLFSRAQRFALLERDGGCASCGAPPGQTQAHHIRWWGRDHGPTDLTNGVMLCSPCHHRIHGDEWEVTVEGTGRDSRVWFTPPAHINPARTPRLGGRARFDLAAGPGSDLAA